jgi:hypothetical protein
MRLAAYIEKNMERILTEWEAFARTLYPRNTSMTPTSLRDHAQPILMAIVQDLGTPQTDREQSEKSMGREPVDFCAKETAAQTHAVLRAQSGLDINQLAAEYRALRASVLRLWEDDCSPGKEGFEDLMRFNEAIDQALAESISFFSAQNNSSRNLLLGMVGHDMRTPLNAIMMVGAELELEECGDVVAEAAATLKRCGASIRELLNDLTDFKSINVGSGLVMEVEDADLGEIVADELRLLRASLPARGMDLVTEGDVRGRWDASRLKQVLRNLVTNAAAYGRIDTSVEVTVAGEGDVVRMEVRNLGTVIDAASLEEFFNPLVRGSEEERKSNLKGSGWGCILFGRSLRSTVAKWWLNRMRRERCSSCGFHAMRSQPMVP